MSKLKIPIELQQYDNPFQWAKDHCHPILLTGNPSKLAIIYSSLHPEDSPICKYSGLIKKFSTRLNKFSECSLGIKCQCHKDKYEEINKRKEQTCISKYGVSNPMLVDEFKAKLDNTNLEKYGCKNPGGNKEVQEKIKNTNLERYGCVNPGENKEIKERIQNTWLKKYGGHPQQTSEVRNKTEQTCLEKYGTTTPFLNNEIKNKITEKMLSLYGVEHALQSEQFQEKRKQTISERFEYDEITGYYPEILKRSQDAMMEKIWS